MTIRFKKRIYRRNRADAQKIADELKMVVNRAGDRLVLSTNRDSFRRRPFETDFRVSVPAGTPVLVRNSYGLVQVAGTGNTDVSNPHGEVTAADIRGEFVLDTSYEPVTVDGVRGPAHLSCPHARAVVKNVQGELVIGHAHGELRLEGIDGKLTVNGRNSKIIARGLGAAAEIRTTYEPVTITRAGALTIRGHHNDIAVTGAAGLCDITNAYGTVRVDDLAGDLKVDARNTAVIGRRLRDGTVSVVTTYEDVELLGFSGGATVAFSHAKLILGPDALAGPLDVRGESGDIRFIWPPSGTRHPFQAEAKQGTIFWGLADPPSVATTNGTSVTKAFLDETSAPLVSIKTTYGDVRVEAAPRRRP
ncbi:MAG: DUF4097 domain-containing protein [Candidatus Aminicenantes bacterium]|nr:DUF4097 domain-containing protein [Candidatus Aminicenantes bacterium]